MLIIIFDHEIKNKNKCKYNKQMNSFNDNSIDNIYLFKRSFSLKKVLNKERKKSIELTKASNDSIKVKEKPNISEHSYKKIKKIKDIMPNTNKNYNQKETISYQNSYFPICLSFMTNTKNYLNNINNKFKIRINSNNLDSKTIADFSTLYNNSVINFNSVQNQNNKKINLNLNFENTKEPKKLIPKINLHLERNKISRNLNKFRPIDTTNNNKSLKIKNYNYFFESVDKSINIYNPKKIFNPKPKKFLESKVFNESENDDQLRQKINAINKFVSMNFSKKKLQKILKNKINTSMEQNQTIELKELKRKDTLKNIKKFDINNITSTKITNEYNTNNDNLILQIPKIVN